MKLSSICILPLTFFILTGCGSHTRQNKHLGNQVSLNKINTVAAEDTAGVIVTDKSAKPLLSQSYDELPAVYSTTASRFAKGKSEYCYLSCPQNAPSDNLDIVHQNYRLSYNIKTKYADWVAYKISRNNLSGSPKARNWRADPEIPKDIALTPPDYKDAYEVCDYDRGHLAPLADFSNSEEWKSMNYLSNITPQKSKLNRGSWADLEHRIREIARKYDGDIYVMTGTYYNRKPTCRLPKAKIPNIVPNGFWKIITHSKGNHVYRAAFIFDQDTPKNSDYCKHLAPVSEISRITSLHFPKVAHDRGKTYDSYAYESLPLMQELGCKADR